MILVAVGVVAVVLAVVMRMEVRRVLVAKMEAVMIGAPAIVIKIHALFTLIAVLSVAAMRVLVLVVLTVAEAVVESLRR